MAGSRRPLAGSTHVTALAFGAIIANRWFVRHRGVVVGVFSAASTELVSNVLLFFSLGLVSFSTFQLLLRAFYAMQDSKTPAIINIASVLAFAPEMFDGVYSGSKAYLLNLSLSLASKGVRTQADFYQKVWNRGGAGTEIPLKLLQGVDVRDVRIKSIDRVQYFRPRTTY